MDNINASNSRPVSFSFTQSIGEHSAQQLNNMDISDLMTLVMTRMLDAKEVQFKQKLAEADARTKKIEGYGEQLKALARLKAEFGADDKDDTSIRDAKGVKDKVSSDQWDESSVDHELSMQKSNATSSTSQKASSKYTAYEELSGNAKWEAWDRVNDYLDANLSDAEMTYLRKGGEGDPVLDASIREKYVKVWHDAGYEPPKTLSNDEITKAYVYVDSTFTFKAERLVNAAKAYNSYQEKQATSKETTPEAETSTADATATQEVTWRSELSDEGQQLMGNVDTFCEQGMANGTLSETDVANIRSGDFKKSDLEALEVAIKNEQDKIGSMNTRDQIDIQKLTNQIDQINNLISTLTKKFNEGATGVINKM